MVSSARVSIGIALLIPLACGDTSSCGNAALGARRRAGGGVDPALPGLGPGNAELTEKLKAAWLEKGSDYRPRTHHLHDGGSPKYINRLIFETSPYLLPHAHK